MGTSCDIDDMMSFMHLHTMGDLLMLQNFDQKKLLDEISKWDHEWKRYNLRKLNNNRWGLSVTSMDGSLSGIANFDSIDNRDICMHTPVFDESATLQEILKPFLPWLTRCSLVRLDAGGFFPEHYDTKARYQNNIDKTTPNFIETRMVAFVKNCNNHSLKFLLEDKVLNVNNGELYWFNASKRHSVFSMRDDCIMLLICLNFDSNLFKTIIENYKVK